MRPSNKSRSRNKSGNTGGSLHNQQNRRGGGNIVNRVFDSAGPDGKVRGTPQQIIDKYLGLARDAQLAGDRVATESFLQHAEHYSRMLNEAQRQQNEQRGVNEREAGERDANERDDAGREDAYRAETRDDTYRAETRDTSGGSDRSARTPSFSSGFATIDPEDVDDPRDRPRPQVVSSVSEGAAHRDREPAQPPVAAELNGSPHAAAEPAEAAAPAAPAAAGKPETPKRTRTRRKAPPAEAPAAQAE